MKKIRAFRIVLQNIPPYYRPGDEVRGVILLDVKKQAKYKDVKMSMWGGSEVMWKEDRTVRSNGRGFFSSTTVTDTFKCSEVYFNFLYIVSDADNWIYEEAMPEGVHEFPFSCQIPRGVSSSFESTFCNVRYKATAEITRAWYKPNHRTEIPITILAPASYDSETYLSPVASRGKLDVGFCCSSGRLSIKAHITKKGFTPGEHLKVVCEIKNYSKKVISPKVEIMETTTCFAGFKSRTVSRIVANVKGQLIRDGTINWTSPKLQIPWNCCSLTDCRLIRNNYTVRVTLVVRALCSQRLEVMLPIMVGDNPLPPPLPPPPPVHIPASHSPYEPPPAYQLYPDDGQSFSFDAKMIAPTAPPAYGI